MKTHLVFHVSLLEPCHESKILRQVQTPFSCIQINFEEEFEVKEILDLDI